MEAYKSVPTKEDGDVEKRNGYRGKNRKNYWKIFPPYFPQVMAVVTGKDINSCLYILRDKRALRL